MWMLLKCESPSESRLELTRVQGRQHGPRAPHTGSGVLVMWISLSAQQLENLSSPAGDCTLKVAAIGEINPRFRGVQALVCKQLLSVGEHTTMGGVAVMYGDKGYLYPQGPRNVAKKFEAWIQKEISSSQHHSSPFAYKENHVYTIYMKAKDDETDASPLSQSSVVLHVG